MSLSFSFLDAQVPLAPQRALTHFGIAARSGLVAFLNQPPWMMKDGDYGLALYVMLSRATTLSDLWLIGVPERPYFEGFLHERNKTLVDRMRLFERLSVESEPAAEKYIQKLDWRQNAYVNRTLGVSGVGQAKRRRLTGKTAVA